MTSSPSARDAGGVASIERPRGWLIVAACFVVAVFSWGFGFYAHGIYLVELQRAHGWSTSLLSSVVTIHYIAGAFLLPFIARAIALAGPVAVFLGGLSFSVAALVALPEVSSPLHLALAYACLAIGWSATGVSPIAVVVGQWFDRRRGLALNLALSGATVSGLVVAPSLIATIATLGFRDGLRSLVLGTGLLAVVAVVTLVRSGPPRGGMARTGIGPAIATREQPTATAAEPATRTILLSAHFWSIAGPFALVLAAQVGLFTHLVPMLTAAAASTDRVGVKADPAFALALATTMALVGRVIFGFVLDRVPQRLAAAASFLNQVAAVLALASSASPAVVYLACAAFGLSVGNNITIAPLIVQREYDEAAFAKVVALSTAVMQILYALGPAALGIVRDATGDYMVPLGICAAFQLAAAFWILLAISIKRP